MSSDEMKVITDLQQSVIYLRTVSAILSVFLAVGMVLLFRIMIVVSKVNRTTNFVYTESIVARSNTTEVARKVEDNQRILKDEIRTAVAEAVSPPSITPSDGIPRPSELMSRFIIPSM